jgi:uncharacterized membrane protein YGL010W
LDRFIEARICLLQQAQKYRAQTPQPLFDFGRIPSLSVACGGEAALPNFMTSVLGCLPRESCSEPIMNAYFKRQLADYVEYHRDPWNCAMHVFGILFLFLAAVLPLSLWPVHALGAHTTVAPIMVLPVLIYWFLLDAALGTAIVGAAVVLLSAAAVIVNYTSSAGVWSISAVLIVIGVGSQIVGHRLFERRQPALVDNPTHLLLGPMFVMAKLFIALGFRDDLAVIIAHVPQQASRGSSPYVKEHQVEPLPHS